MKKILIVLIVVLAANCNCPGEQSEHKHPEPNFSEEKAEKVLGLLELSKPDLAEVQQAYNKKEFLSACEKLFQYYRNGHHIKYLIDHRNKASAGTLSEQDRKWGEDAMEHRFVGSPRYSTYFQGWDIDWKNNPTNDLEWMAQLHRMFWATGMGKLYWHTNNEKYAKEWTYQFLDWIKKNPIDDSLAWRAFQAGHRLKRFTDTFEYFIDSNAMNPAVMVEYLDMIYIHNEYMLDKYSKGNNIALSEARGALSSSIYFSQFKDAAKWREKAIAVLVDGIDSQVFPDGMQWELALTYHRGCADIFLEMHQLAVQNGCISRKI